MGNIKPQELANTAWAFATLRHADAWLFAAFAKEAERRMSNTKPQELANTAWAFVTFAMISACEKGKQPERAQSLKTGPSLMHSQCLREERGSGRSAALSDRRSTAPRDGRTSHPSIAGDIGRVRVEPNDINPVF